MTSTLSGVPGGSFYGYDGHGNVRYLTGTAGTATDTYVYDAFGLPVTTTGTTPNNFLYSGEQYDGALGAYYLRARYYNPATGRFLTMDPREGSVLLPMTLHRFLFTGDDPVDGIDPSGEQDIAEYKFLRQVAKGLGLQVHHLLEQRFRKVLLTAACEIGTALAAGEHQEFTNAFRDAIPYGTACVSAEEIYNAAYDVYDDFADEYPELLQWLEVLLDLD